MLTKALNTSVLNSQKDNGLDPHSIQTEKLSLPSMPSPCPWLNQPSAQAGDTYLFEKSSGFTFLNYTGLKIASSSNPKQLVASLYQASSKVVDTTNYAVAFYDAQTDTLTFSLILYQGRRSKSFVVKRSHIRGLINQILTERRPLLIQDILQLNKPIQYEPIRPPQPVRSFLGMPIFNPFLPQENAQGVIIVWSDQPNAFNDGQARQLSELGPPAAVAIRSIQLYQSNQRQTAALAVINDIAQTLASTLQLDELLSRMMMLVEGMLKVEAGALLLTDPTTNELVFQVALGSGGQTEAAEPFRLPKGQNVASYVALTGQKPVLIPKVDSKRRSYVKQLASHLQIEPRNCLYVPLILKEQVIGVLVVMNKTNGTFTQNDTNLLESIATYTAIAIDNARLHENVLAEWDRVMEVEEQVRSELARDLHDGPTQLVSSIMMRLSHSQQLLTEDPSQLPAEITEMQKLGWEAIHQMRTTMAQLLPLELQKHGHGLAAALQGFLERRQTEVPDTKITGNITSCHSDDQISRQEPQVEKAIFNIIQEAVNNAIKHAQSGRIWVQLEETSDMILVLIADDGRGFDRAKTMKNYAQRGSLGMVNLQERAKTIGGELTITSNIGQGTQVRLEVPISKMERLRKRGTTGLLTLPDIPPGK